MAISCTGQVPYLDNKQGGWICSWRRGKGGRVRGEGVTRLLLEPSTGVYVWPYPVFEAAGYGEIQRGYS